jgi:hypothetical protein
MAKGNSTISSNNRLSPFSINKSQIILILAASGAFLQVAGANWDITLHLTRIGDREGNRLLVDAETFFSSSHIFLYMGVGLTTIAAVSGSIMLVTYYYNNSKSLLYTKPSLPSFTTAFKLLILGCGLQLVAGPFDLWWHTKIGLDGLLSPPHLLLIVGMLVNATAASVGLTRIIIRISPLPPSYVSLPTSSTKSKIPSKLIIKIINDKIITKAGLVLAFAALWLSATWLVYAFVLPISQGKHFNFNMNPILAVIISIIVLPLISAIVFVTAYRTIGGFGGASTVALLVILTNVFANIIPSKQLVQFIPWYLLILIPAVIISDMLLNKSRNTASARNDDNRNAITRRVKIMMVGAIIGSVFYVFNFPMLSLTFAVAFGTPIPIIMEHEMANFLNTFFIALSITLLPGFIMGMIGASIMSNKIKVLSFPAEN